MVVDKGKSKIESSTARLVAKYKADRKNRVYYKKAAEAKSFQDLGTLQLAEKSKYDLLSLDESVNDTIYLHGIDPDGSHFELELAILSLHDDILRPNKESRWRLGRVTFLYQDTKTNSKYSYKHEELIDYDSRRKDAREDKHTNLNTIKIGSLTLEVVLPFGYNRILFQGLFVKEYENGLHQLVPGRLAISSHPTSDKFDYKYRFNQAYTTNAVNRSLNPHDELCRSPDSLIQTILEDRIDQPLMYHAHFQILSLDKQKSLMWGAKVKKFIDLKDETHVFKGSRLWESLILWADCGHLIHLNRPVDVPCLINGMIHNTFEYPSHLYATSWGRGGDECSFEKELGQLANFENLSNGCKIKIIGFKTKENIIEICEDIDQSGGLTRIRINGFDGWALHRREHIASQLEEARNNLLAMNLDDKKFCLTLASDRLLGGKGFSLVGLSNMVRMVDKKVPNVVSGERNNGCVEVNVPRGVIMTSVAYKLWLDSDDRIARAIEVLDAYRRLLSARSYYVNPYSEKYLPMTDYQRSLTDECKKTVALLESCPLPELTKAILKAQLLEIFGENGLNDKLFAVRSSALGEDSLETSAAGQMKTILNAKGFDMICKSIVSCWASQFEVPAVTYKTQSGLSFNWPMAVIVQELIQCHSAGVGATCEPLMGNPRQLEITACLGLGEGVVTGQATDTIRLDLTELAWDFHMEQVGAMLSLENIEQSIKLEPSDGQRHKRYLTNELLVSLGNLLLWIRNNRHLSADNLKDREVEWGMTWHRYKNGDYQYLTNPSSSISSSEQLLFKLHLFQSRPLTNLQRLSTREVDFELDNGLSGPAELISRANIGEVMPGSFSPLSMCILTLQAAYVFRHECNDKNYSMKVNANPGFSYAGRIPSLNVTNPALLALLGGGMSKSDRQSFALNIGMEPEMADEIMKLIREKLNPSMVYGVFTSKHHHIGDMGLLDVKLKQLRKQCNNSVQNLKQLVPTSFDQWVKKMEEQIVSYNVLYIRDKFAEYEANMVRDIEKIFNFLTSYDNPFYSIWFCFNEASQCSAHFNKLCIEHLSKQPYYTRPENADKVLVDFSVLIKGTTKTESGDISNFLEKLVDSLEDQDLLQKVIDLTPKEIYELLTQPNYANNDNQQQQQQQDLHQRASQSLSSMFEQFIEENGHRGWKEYDVSANTWVDDPSQIIKSLRGRVKQRLAHNKKAADSKLSSVEQSRSEAELTERSTGKIFKNIETNKIWFKNYLLNGARRGIVRRELAKSLWVHSVHLLRMAYRHMAGLLCLLGIMPNIDLLPFLNIEELDNLVSGPWMSESEIAVRSDIARLLYKARRRQQRTRVLDKVATPKPTMKLTDFYDLIYDMTEDKSVAIQDNQQQIDSGVSDRSILIRGLTSCAGLVTGRACVIGSLDEVDEIQEDDILITHSIDVSWTVYFYTLSGIVTELGGLVSHGAVVAREYGIPTLCTAMGACSKFKTGQIVTLDANNSCCYLVSEKALNNEDK